MNFWKEKLDYSYEQINSDILKIKAYFQKCVSVNKTTVEQDRRGFDYIARLEGGATILIDAKARVKGSSRYWKHNEPELALELYSVVEDKKIGWTLSDSSNVDYILFTFDPTDAKLFYILPFQQLRKAFWRNFKLWKQTYDFKEQESDGWHSQAIFVPASVVVLAIANLMVLKNNLGETRNGHQP